MAAGWLSKSFALLFGIAIAASALSTAYAQSTPPVLLSDPAVESEPGLLTEAPPRNTVGVTFEVTSSGIVADCIVTEPSGSAVLDSDACRAAYRWRYQPATVDGLPVAVFVTATVTFTITGAPTNAGAEAFRRRDYAGAITSWTPLAERGDVIAQRGLGVLYGAVREDYVQAIKWLQLAAAQNDAIAQRSLGTHYEEGNGVRRNYSEAAKWYGLAAAQNDGEAQAKLGVLHAEGRLGRRDYAEAIKWYRLAAKQRIRVAMFDLAEAYESGRGVPKDLVYAYMWYNISLSAFDESRLEEAIRGTAIARRLERSLSRDEMIRAMAMATYCQRSELDGCADVMFMASAVNEVSLERATRDRDALDAALALREAITNSQSPNRRIVARAVPVLRSHADRGEPRAQIALASLYEHGHGVEQNMAEAVKLIRAAAAKGSPEAQVTLAEMYETGRGVPENPLKALMWFTLNNTAEDRPGALARVNGGRLRQRMAQVQVDQVDAMVVRCRESKFQDCD